MRLTTITIYRKFPGSPRIPEKLYRYLIIEDAVPLDENPNYIATVNEITPSPMVAYPAMFYGDTFGEATQKAIDALKDHQQLRGYGMSISQIG